MSSFYILILKSGKIVDKLKLFLNELKPFCIAVVFNLLSNG